MKPLLGDDFSERGGRSYQKGSHLEKSEKQRKNNKSPVRGKH